MLSAGLTLKLRGGGGGGEAEKEGERKEAVDTETQICISFCSLLALYLLTRFAACGRLSHTGQGYKYPRCRLSCAQ